MGMLSIIQRDADCYAWIADRLLTARLFWQSSERMNILPTVYNKYHGNAPEGSIYIGRPSVYGNPFEIGRDGTREEVIETYRDYVENNPELITLIQQNLRGKDLVCFCAPKACHGDILLEIANN